MNLDFFSNIAAISCFEVLFSFFDSFVKMIFDTTWIV